MDVLPYRLDLQFTRFPWLTALVALTCLGIFWAQDDNEQELLRTTAAFCEAPRPVMFRMALKRVTGYADAEACADVLLDLHFANDPTSTLRELLSDTRPLPGMTRAAGEAILAGAVETEYGRYAGGVPPSLTAELWYWPSSWDPWRMITSSFSHGDWPHVLFNLIFFAAFAVAVELIAGPLAFAAIVIGTSIFSSVFYSIFSLGVGTDVPSLGLSDVVMAMITLLAFFAPQARLRCVVGWLPLFRRLSIPVWLVAAWYVGWDVWYLFTNEDSDGINLVAHVAGAAFGYLVGVCFLRKRREAVWVG